MAWIGATIAFGSVVRKANRSFVVSPSLTFRTDVQRVQMPAKKASGRLSSSANQTGGREPSGWSSFSEKPVNGTTHRLSTPSHRRQWGEATLRTLVTPESEFRCFGAADLTPPARRADPPELQTSRCVGRMWVWPQYRPVNP